jgi:hypothetical protein
MARKTRLTAATLSIACISLLTACLHVWEYSARGRLDVAGRAQTAVLYWFSENGRLYYLGQHDQTEDTAELRICGSIPIKLTDTGAAEGIVIKASDKGDDFVVKSKTATGELVATEPLQQEGGANRCGTLYVQREQQLTLVHLKDLREGDHLILDVFCEKRPVRPQDTHPAAGRYVLGPIARAQEGKEVDAPLPCGR